MAKLSITVEAKSYNPETRIFDGPVVNHTFDFEEVGNESGYGCGQYIHVVLDGKEGLLAMPNLDCRYMKGYSLEKAAVAWIKEQYATNLVSYKVAA